MRIETLLLDRAKVLTLTPPETAVFGGGLRVLGATVGQSACGVFARKPCAVTKDCFVNLPPSCRIKSLRLAVSSGFTVLPIKALSKHLQAGGDP